MPKIAEVVGSPAVHFDDPKRIVDEPALSTSEKLVALATWEKDAEALDVAADEGMVPLREEEPIRSKIEQAKEALLGDEPLTITPDQRSSSMNRTVKLQAAKLSDDAAAVAADVGKGTDDVGALARHAIEAIRAIADQFTSSAGVKAEEAVGAVKAVGSTTAEAVGRAAGQTRDLTQEGIEAVTEAIAKRPLTSLAIAAGVGLLIGLANRPDQRS